MSQQTVVKPSNRGILSRAPSIQHETENSMKHQKRIAKLTRAAKRIWVLVCGRSLKRRVLSHIRQDDVFIVTYPRSGTTWLGYMLACLLARERSEELTLLESSFGRVVPDINNEYYGTGSLTKYADLKSPRIFRTHARFQIKFPNVVYLVRDPRDVMVSYYHFLRFTKPHFDISLEHFVLTSDSYIYPWDKHVSGWLCESVRPRRLIVRYEDFHEHCADVLASVCEFSHINCSREDISKAVECGKFERMREIEERFGMDGQRGSSGERFVRRGKVGGWRGELDENCRCLIEQRYEKLMERLGYSLGAVRSSMEAFNQASGEVPG
jgi:Sulfotransferase domain